MGPVQRRAIRRRLVPAGKTLREARSWAARIGLGRVIDITPLDRIGCPVFASIRPNASATPVSFGKGLRPIDAEVGAYMEAIETFFAEPGAGAVECEWRTAGQVAGADRRRDAILDFSPIYQRSIDLERPLLLARAHDVDTGEPCLVPAELVYHPAPDVGQPVFGSSTNGLASGNSVLEASIHALAEVIERDIWSFEAARNTSRFVDPATLPAFARAVLERISGSGLPCAVRQVPNAYGLAFFAVFIFDPKRPEPATFNGGWGCHTNRRIALTGALCEAAQSRLAFIHGLRSLPAGGRLNSVGARVRQQRSVRAAMSTERSSAYRDVPSVAVSPDPDRQWDELKAHLRRVTDMPIYRVVYTAPRDPLQIVRIIVPTLEDFRPETMRVGPRLRDALDA